MPTGRASVCLSSAIRESFTYNRTYRWDMFGCSLIYFDVHLARQSLFAYVTWHCMYMDYICVCVCLSSPRWSVFRPAHQMNGLMDGPALQKAVQPLGIELLRRRPGLDCTAHPTRLGRCRVQTMSAYAPRSECKRRRKKPEQPHNVKNAKFGFCCSFFSFYFLCLLQLKF